MLDPIEITMEAVKTFSDPHYDNSAKSLFLYPEILAPILANVVPEYQGMLTEQVMEYIVKSSIRRDGVSNEPKHEYDLLSVVLIRLGDDTKKEPIFQYLNDFFAGDIDGMCKYINIKKNKELVKGVKQVMTLSQSIFSRGIQEGLAEGEAKGRAKGIAEGEAKGRAKGITEGEAKNFIFSVKTLMKNTNKSKEEVLAMLGKTNQDYINALQVLSDNN